MLVKILFTWTIAIFLLVITLDKTSASLRSNKLSSALHEVEIAQGTVRGLHERTPVSKRSYFAFRGIPFAQPPVGELRFKEPVKAKPWPGVWNATEQPPDCLQLIEGVTDWRFQVIGDENCLFLNVFTPKINPGKNLMKVIVFIHGGAFMYLSSNYSGPQYMMEKDVVLVTVNYRLGPLGFLSTQDSTVPGNNGLKDQNLALKWVQENIRAFGGDPGQVAIAGESAGSSSVIYHMLSTQSRGLFTHAMALSGSPLSPWGVAEGSSDVAKRLSDHFGCPTKDSKEMIACLRTRPVRSIVQSTNIFMPWRFFSPYGPVIEPRSSTAFIDEEPIKMLLSGKSVDIPLLISFTDEEGTYPARGISTRAIQNDMKSILHARPAFLKGILATPSDLQRLKNEWSDLLPILLNYNYTVEPSERMVTAERIRNKYFPDDPKSFVKMLSDRIFLAGIGENARILSERNKSPVYSYRFRYAMKSVPPSRIYPGVGHGDDLPFILREVGRSVENNTDDLAVSNLMVNIWMDFITNTMPSNWTTVKDELPKFTYKEINCPRDKDNVIRSEADFGNITFWKSLNLRENVL